MCLRYNKFSVFVKKIKKYYHNICCSFFFLLNIKVLAFIMNFSKKRTGLSVSMCSFLSILLFTLLISQKMYSIDKQVNLSCGFYRSYQNYYSTLN